MTSPLAELNRLAVGLRTHVGELGYHGATPQVRMTYDDLCAISALLDRLTSPEALETMARAAYEARLPNTVRNADWLPWDVAKNVSGFQEAWETRVSAALSTILQESGN